MNKQLMKQHISDMFVQMCEESGFSNISVTDLCERCSINRGTFYYHFLDLNDLVCWIYHQEITIPSIKFIDENKEGITQYILDLLYSKKKFILQVFGNSNPETEKIFKNEAEQVWMHVYDLFIQQSPQLDESKRQTLKLVITYFCNAHWYATYNWIKDGMKFGPEQFAHALNIASSNGLKGTLKELLAK